MIQCRVELNEQNYRINQFSTKIVFWSKSFSKIFVLCLGGFAPTAFFAVGGSLYRLRRMPSSPAADASSLAAVFSP
jgi:hypothetical protein